MEENLQQSITQYQKVLADGHVQRAFRALMEFMLKLRTQFIQHYPSGYVSSGLHPGYLDISYFPFTPVALKQQKLKIAVVLNHEEMQFEVWLAGQNKTIHKKYWEIFQGSDWPKDNIAPSPEHMILREVVVASPDFDEPQLLMNEIESCTMTFIEEVMAVLVG